MSTELKVVAILTATPALSSLLHMVLSERRDLRVRAFESEAELSLYMHLAPVDLLICDYDDETDGPASVVPRLRAKRSLVRPDFQVIALTRTVSASMKAACVAAGIDEVIVKPMSPKYLEDRVLARLKDGARQITRAGSPNRPAPSKSQPTARLGQSGSNVVPLFAGRTAPGQPHA